jgi:sugar phosphate isomerase/epimerase
LEHLEAVNDDFFVACLDIGHAEMKGLDTTAVDMILKLGRHVQALQIHDNDKWHDTHQIPCSMDIDFEQIVAALKRIEYQGYFTLEANAYLNGYEASNILDGLKELQQSVRRLADTYEIKY